MSLTRSKQSKSGDIAEQHLKLKFLERGWTAEKVEFDYGEDLMVRIFEDNGQSTPLLFFVQSKGDQDPKFNIGRNRYEFSPKPQNLSSWDSMWQPVFLVLWDHSTNVGWWDWVQRPKAKRHITDDGNVYLGLPYKLDDDGLNLMEGMVRNHFQEVAQKEDLHKEIAAEIKQSYGVDIQHDSSGEVAVIQGHKGITCISTGRTASAIDRFETKIAERMAPDASPSEVTAKFAEAIKLGLERVASGPTERTALEEIIKNLPELAAIQAYKEAHDNP